MGKREEVPAGYHIIFVKWITRWDVGAAARRHDTQRRARCSGWTYRTPRSSPDQVLAEIGPHHEVFWGSADLV
jgi:hypothetical protein